MCPYLSLLNWRLLASIHWFPFWPRYVSLLLRNLGLWALRWLGAMQLVGAWARKSLAKLGIGLSSIEFL